MRARRTKKLKIKKVRRFKDGWDIHESMEKYRLNGRGIERMDTQGERRLGDTRVNYEIKAVF